MMLTEQQELNSELQELYLVTKQWVTDLAFVNDELIIIEERLITVFSIAPSTEELHKKFTIRESALQLKVALADVKHETSNHIHALERLISLSAIQIGVELIERHSAIERHHDNLLRGLKALRAVVFMLAKTEITISQHKLEHFCFQSDAR